MQYKGRIIVQEFPIMILEKFFKRFPHQGVSHPATWEKSWTFAETKF